MLFPEATARVIIFIRSIRWKWNESGGFVWCRTTTTSMNHFFLSIQKPSYVMTKPEGGWIVCKILAVGLFSNFAGVKRKGSLDRFPPPIGFADPCQSCEHWTLNLPLWQISNVILIVTCSAHAQPCSCPRLFLYSKDDAKIHRWKRAFTLAKVSVLQDVILMPFAFIKNWRNLIVTIFILANLNAAQSGDVGLKGIRPAFDNWSVQCTCHAASCVSLHVGGISPGSRLW